MVKVKVYSTPSCTWCHKAKDFLNEHKIKFEDINVAEDRAKAQEMIDKSGQMGVPVLDVGGTIIIGFDKDALTHALHLKH